MASASGISLGAKIRAVERLLGRSVDRVFKCPTGDVGYRMKISVRLSERKSQKGQLAYAFSDQRTRALKPLTSDHFPIATKRINDALKPTREFLQTIPTLRDNIFEAKFHATMFGELALTLCYRRAFDSEKWLEAAQELETILKNETEAKYVSIVGRSRKKVESTGRNYLLEEFEVDYMDHIRGRKMTKALMYKQNMECFSQPNAMVNKLMLEWSIEAAQKKRDIVDNDLLELYCGNGNFTIALAATTFDKVLASEVGRDSVRDAEWGLIRNDIRNTNIVRLSAAEVTEALFGERQFQRLRHIDLEEYRFRTILVDPPRVGLDEDSVRLLSSHGGQVIYISCNPVTLKRDLERIRESSGRELKIHELVCFDQFPSTDHIECGVEFELV